MTKRTRPSRLVRSCSIAPVHARAAFKPRRGEHASPSGLKPARRPANQTSSGSDIADAGTGWTTDASADSGHWVEPDAEPDASWDSAPGWDAGADSAPDSEPDAVDPKEPEEGPIANTNINLGGSQDFGFFRRQLDENTVPVPGTFEASGFFSEHHTPLPVPDCGQRV